jgi:hypothetical protein
MSKKANNSKALFSKHKLKKYKKPAVIVVIFAILATGLLLFVSAAVSTSSVEVENGQVSWPAVILGDQSASNNSAVSFKKGAFTHPGILMSKQQLDFVKAKIANGERPWSQAYDAARSNFLGNITRPITPVPEVKCTDSQYLPPKVPSYPPVGCEQLRDQANAAYTQALLWYYSGEQKYADSAIRIINAWATTHKKTWFDQPRMVNGQVVYGQPGDNSDCPSTNPCYQIYSNGLLFNAWAAQSMTRAAEILRYSNSGWSQQDIQKAETYFKTVHLDALGAGWASTSNWETSVAEAWVNIGIFTNDYEIFNKGLAYWRQETPRYMYMQSDGVLPLNPYKKIVWVTGTDGVKYPTSQITPTATKAAIDKTWEYPSRYISGLGKETCRDIGHNYMGFGGIANVAETARIQGIDLYSEQKDRIIAAYELNAGYSNEALNEMDVRGWSYTATNLNNLDQPKSGWYPKNNWPCPRFLTGGGSLMLGQEIAYNHYARRLGISMPQTKRLVERVRPSLVGNHMVWETLTHAGTP